MPDILQALKNLIQSQTDDEPKPALHIGEAMSCWLYVTMLSEALVYEQVAVNTTTNPDVQRVLAEGIEMCTKQVEELRYFLQQEGVPLPPTSEPKTKSDPAAVPLGVKLNDEEIANGLSVKVVAAVIHCASTFAEAVRTDVGTMFLRFQMELVTYGLSLKTLMKQRGWMKYPPAYLPPGSHSRT